MIRIQSLLTGEYREAAAAPNPSSSSTTTTPSSSSSSSLRGGGGGGRGGFLWHNGHRRKNNHHTQPPTPYSTTNDGLAVVVCQKRIIQEEEKSVTTEDEEDDEITTLDASSKQPPASERSFSISSTQPGDSFVHSFVANDSVMMNPNNKSPTRHHRNPTIHMDSPTDPYLESKEDIRKRLSKDQPHPTTPIRSVTRILLGQEEERTLSNHSKSRHSLDSLIGSHPNSSSSSSSRGLESPIIQNRINSMKQNGPTASSGAKSMGSFSFPLPSDEYDDDVATGGAIRYLAIPKSMHFGRSSRSVQSQEQQQQQQRSEDVTSNDDTDTSTEQQGEHHPQPNDDNNISMHVEMETSIGNIIPLTIAKPVTPSRKKRIEASQHVAHIQQRLANSRQQPLRTAYLFLELGKTYMMPLHRYLEAISSFFQAAAIFRHLQNQNVAMATALDYAAQTYGLARQRGHADTIHEYHEMTRFETCLYEAWKHRSVELGPYHIDTVDTLQHLAQHYVVIEQPQRALELFSKVVSIRRSMFGPDHPSIAVLAHCLGNAQLQSHNTPAAEEWYGVALEIYNLLQLPNHNPAVRRLLDDRKRLQRVQRWMDGSRSGKPSIEPQKCQGKIVSSIGFCKDNN
jgi:tetratricopeptide (TPR) repeat protein